MTEALDDWVTTYRATTSLFARSYREQTIKHLVLTLSLSLKRAVFQGADHATRDLATILHICEPLHERTLESREGFLLRIASLVHIEHDLTGALQVAKEAQYHFPNDPLLRLAVKRLRQGQSD